MYIFYLDESGNTGNDLSSSVEPVHWLVAIAVTPLAVRNIEADMLGIALKYFKNRGSEAEFEFHGSHIFSGRGEARLLTPNERVSLYSDIMALVQRHSCRIWIRGIDKPLHQWRATERGYRPEHPHKLGFMYLVESLDSWLEAQQPDPSLLDAESEPVYGLLVSDQQDEVSRDLVGRFANWRQTGTDHGYRTRDIKYLIDTVHSVPSQDSWLIQLVDCVAYLRNRCEKIRRQKGWIENKYSASDKAVIELWNTGCRNAVIDERIWPPPA